MKKRRNIFHFLFYDTFGSNKKKSNLIAVHLLVDGPTVAHSSHDDMSHIFSYFKRCVMCGAARLCSFFSLRYDSAFLYMLFLMRF